MKLRNLNAQLVKYLEGFEGGHRRVWSLEEAQGLLFQCPKCAEGLPNEQVGDGTTAAIGAHYVLCWFRGKGVPDDEYPGPGRWAPSGLTIDDFSLSPSVNLSGPGCKWHGWVKDGSAQ